MPAGVSETLCILPKKKEKIPIEPRGLAGVHQPLCADLERRLQNVRVGPRDRGPPLLHRGGTFGSGSDFYHWCDGRIGTRSLITTGRANPGADSQFPP